LAGRHRRPAATLAERRRTGNESILHCLSARVGLLVAWQHVRGRSKRPAERRANGRARRQHGSLLQTSDGHPSLILAAAMPADTDLHMQITSFHCGSGFHKLRLHASGHL